MTALKYYILGSRIPQYELAQRVGITETRLSRLATGRATPNSTERTSLARALNVDPDRLFPQSAGGPRGAC